jgi:hypothetical protein
LSNLDPAKMTAVNQRVQQILNSGRMPEWGVPLCYCPWAAHVSHGARLEANHAMERLKEFGPGFEGPLDFSPELVSKAMVGTMMSFGIQLKAPGSE